MKKLKNFNYISHLRHEVLCIRKFARINLNFKYSGCIRRFSGLEKSLQYYILLKMKTFLIILCLYVAYVSAGGGGSKLDKPKKFEQYEKKVREANGELTVNIQFL